MISREKIAVYKTDKDNQFELAIACIEVSPILMAGIKKEAGRFGYVRDTPVYMAIHKSYDFGLDVHATYDPDEVAQHIRDYGEKHVY